VRLNNNGDKPTVLGQLRINIGGRGEQAFRTTPATASCSPEWNQNFVLPGLKSLQIELQLHFCLVPAPTKCGSLVPHNYLLKDVAFLTERGWWHVNDGKGVVARQLAGWS